MYVDMLYVYLEFIFFCGLKCFLECDIIFYMIDDFVVLLGIDFIVKFFDMCS